MTTVNFDNDVNLVEKEVICVVNRGEDLTAIDFDGNVSLTEKEVVVLSNPLAEVSIVGLNVEKLALFFYDRLELLKKQAAARVSRPTIAMQWVCQQLHSLGLEDDVVVVGNQEKGQPLGWEGAPEGVSHEEMTMARDVEIEASEHGKNHRHIAGEDGAGSGGNFPVGITGSAHAAVCDEEEGGVGGLQRWIEGGWRERGWKKKKIVALFLSGNRASQESTSGCGCGQQRQNRQLIGAWLTDLVGSVRGVGDRVRQRMKSGEKSAPAAASGLEDDVAAVGKQGKGRSRLGGCGQSLLWRIHRSPRARRRRRWWSNASAAVSSLPEMLAAEAEIWKVATGAASSAVGKGHGARLTARGLRRWFGRWQTEEEYFAEESTGGGSRKALIP
ncbi:hypothetical protein B296_00052969 [Ensete ventricosum]|uniref:Uncharacterized protein n=1 Tax=Ensete ventricosum TaxID=4639 RepID=A0A426XJ61_ENSVE|nr:hypothetical protein B296_00052969 [Ensete ventricosum]